MTVMDVISIVCLCYGSSRFYKASPMLTSGAQLFPLSGCILGPPAFGGIAAVMGMPAAFVLAAASTLAGTAILAAPHRLFAERFRYGDRA
jgi:hypothetical protein